MPAQSRRSLIATTAAVLAFACGCLPTSTPSAGSPPNAGAPAPQPNPPAPNPPAPNPNPPPGVKHDIPKEGDNYSKRPAWESQVRSNCDDAGYPDDCLILTYVFSVEDPPGHFTTIGDPGTGYDGYKKCAAIGIKPKTGNSKKVAPHTKIKVPVICTPEKP